eukprot:TRINITY_DN63577_c1_g2_i1.p2 TRINITY_DN63577_c1_g2~~TRINITY_DN63577_c1_g2_i1.p2  ORF type:complete len:601 (+),score=287.99 TRINITY_DN63577_c1_g2_i1:46-1848(+)
MMVMRGLLVCVVAVAAVLAAPQVHAMLGDEHLTPGFLQKRLKNGEWDLEQIPREFFQQPKTVAADGAATLVPTPAQLCSKNDSIKVSWTGVASPGWHDWIGIYIPETSADHDYIDWFYAHTDPGYMSGSGAFEFPVVNMRQNFQFRYFQNGYHLVATSATVDVCSDIPMHTHLAMSDKPNSMRVNWVSDSNNTVPQVLYGTSSGSYDKRATGTSRTYTAADMCNAPANITSSQLFRDPGFTHDVLMTGLEPGVKYYYKVGLSGGRQSEEFSFTMAPKPSPTAPVRFAAFGDMGAGVLIPEATSTARSLAEHGWVYDFVLHFGDLSYARSHGYVWEFFGNIIEPIASTHPYMVSIGNHEYDHVAGGEHDPSGANGPAGWHPSWGNLGADSHGECARPVHERFHMPDNGNGVFWYSFDYGSVHVIQFSSEHDWTQGSRQFNWIVNDLKNVDRSKTPWVVVTSHRPMYTSQNYTSDYIVSEHMQTELEETWYKYGVDIFLTGHYHSYERTCAVYKQKCVGQQNGGVTNIVVGTAGAGMEDAGWFDKPWSECHYLEYGWGLVDVSTSSSGLSTLTWKYILNKDGSVQDEVTLKKNINQYLNKNN